MNKAEAQKIVDGMAAWFRNVSAKHKVGDKRDGRTREECIFDSGVFAASEFIRRATKDEQLSGLVHECCIWAQKQRQASSQRSEQHA